MAAVTCLHNKQINIILQNKILVECGVMVPA